MRAPSWSRCASTETGAREELSQFAYLSTFAHATVDTISSSRLREEKTFGLTNQKEVVVKFVCQFIVLSGGSQNETDR